MLKQKKHRRRLTLQIATVQRRKTVSILAVTTNHFSYLAKAQSDVSGRALLAQRWIICSATANVGDAVGWRVVVLSNLLIEVAILLVRERQKDV